MKKKVNYGILRDILAKCEGKIVRIGSSTGYYVCGKWSEDLEKDLATIEDRMKNQRRNSVAKMKDELAYARKNLPKLKKELGAFGDVANINTRFKTLEEKTSFAELMKRVNMYKAKIETYPSKIRDGERYLKNYTPFLDREVVDIYKSAIKPGEVSILVSGGESGPFWDCEEFNRWKTTGIISSESNHMGVKV